ncbi:MAG: EAL domain-containing protein [Alphaproteobacteria bacterium]|nr:MAG: EAL domain-containing protein [Alphaproteobacteria bacterium]
MPSMRFQTKLTLVYLALFLTVQGVVLLAFNGSIPQNVQGQIQNQLSASARVLERILAGRVEQLAASTQLLAQDFGIRGAVATGDRPTVVSALKNHKARLGADLAFVVAPDDSVLAAVVGNAETRNDLPPVPDALKETAERRGLAASIVTFENRLFYITLVPVQAPDLVGWLAFGFELDEKTAEEIRSLSAIALDLAFLYRTEGGPFMLAAATGAQMELRDFLTDQTEADHDEVFRASFGGQDYMFWRLPIVDVEDSPVEVAVLLYYSVDVGMAPYKSLVAVLFIVAGAGLVILVLGSMVVARGMTRPLRGLANAAHNIAEGDYQEVSSPTRDVEIADLTASFNRMVSAVKDREDHIRHQANHDIETGLPNRLMFEQMLQGRLAAGGDFALMVIEVQQVPELRSVLNHRNVNDLMIAIGERLAQVADTDVARISTESFALLLDDLKESDVVASLIQNCFLTPFEIAEIVIDASVKLGMVRCPRDGADVAALLRHASAALDVGRTSPKGFAWYDPESDSSQKQRLSLMSEFREGINNGEVRFAYQPKLDLTSGKITAVEALVRWISPSRGFVPPDEFIPLAERTGDVRHLTEWGLKEAVRQCAEWRSRGIDLAVAVNLSTSDLMNQNLPGQILALLHDHKVPPASLKLEVTESAVMHDMSRALDVLNMLAAMGLTLSIDDYGTGYSSLSYIKRLPVSEIKIDKSFVLQLAKSEEDNILVRSTIELGHNLGLTVTAEGVEDEVSMRRLQSYGCDTVQGYYIARPLSAADLEAFLKESAYG